MARALRPSLRAVSCALAILLVCGVSVTMAAASSAVSTITRAPFGKTPAGTSVDLYTLRNHAGMQARITNYGGIVTYLTAPDREGRYADVVLGYDTLDQYLKASPYFGALIGRYGNRIAHGKFTLDGVTSTLSTNNGPNSLHGGKAGFDKVVWKVIDARVTDKGPQLTLRYLSHDGEEGYPGNLTVTATYTLTEDNALRLEYRATTDRDTVLNLTQHSYFNLRGSGDVLGHIVEIHADRYTPVDATLIPTGELRPVAGSPFDFRKPISIGERIGVDDEQLRYARGYDHNWVLNTPDGQVALDASVYEPETGRVLEVLSTQPGLQFYTGNFLDGTLVGKGGQRYELRSGFCMEPQHFPDSPNRPEFPSTILKPGQIYRATIVYRFTTRVQSEKNNARNEDATTVETTLGPIQGVLRPTTINYLGIPYAAPPVGDLRWRPPEPHGPWESVLDASKFGYHCLQGTVKSKQRLASENCLFLNVYVPVKRQVGREARSLKPWPVMVWIHGGANARGASDDYDPTPLVETNGGVVVVTLNYRLGPFGFLAHPALDAEGHAAVNYGILDQQLALRWVRANIDRFGGDAHNVTVFGHSSGGLDIATHLASPLSAGLFDKAIIQSGAYQFDTPSLADSEKLGIAFANRAGCTNQSATCLRELSASAVVAQAGEVNTPGAAYNQSTIDGQILLESQREAFEAGRICRVPVLQGNNSDEGRQLQRKSRDEYLTTVRAVAKALGRDPDKALAVYPIQRYSSPKAAVSAVVGDGAFACTAQASNGLLSEWVPTYAYEFADPAGGAYAGIHGGEQRYLLNVKHDLEDFVDSDKTDIRTEIAITQALDGGPATLPAQSRQLSKAMRLAWTAFARSGSPATVMTPDWPGASTGIEVLRPSLPGPLPTSVLRARHHCEFWYPLRAAK